MRKFLLLIACLLCLVEAKGQNNESAKETDELLDKAYETMLNNPGQALNYASKALDKAKKINDSTRIVRALCDIGHAYKLFGEFDLSASYQYQAKSYCPSKDIRLLAHINLNLGTLYTILGDYPYAIELIDKATHSYKALNDSNGIANAYNSRGLVHTYMEDYDVAEKFFKDALRINRIQKNEYYIAVNISNLALYKGDTKEKIALLHEAIGINEKRQSFWALAENYNNLGLQYTYNKQYDEALKALNTAYDYAKKVGARDLVRDNMEYRSNLYAEKKDYTQAYKYRLQYEEESAALLSEKRITSIERKVAHQRLQDVQNEKKLQEQEHSTELWKRNFAIILIVVIFLMLAAFFSAKLYKRRKNLEVEKARAESLSKDKVITDLKLQQQAHEIEIKSRKLESVQREITSFVIFVNNVSSK